MIDRLRELQRKHPDAIDRLRRFTCRLREDQFHYLMTCLNPGWSGAEAIRAFIDEAMAMSQKRGFCSTYFCNATQVPRDERRAISFVKFALAHIQRKRPDTTMEDLSKAALSFCARHAGSEYFPTMNLVDWLTEELPK